MKQKRFVDVI